jgi:hypothetical protein
MATQNTTPFFPSYLGVNDIGGVDPGMLSATYEDPVIDVVPGAALQAATINGVETDASINDFLPNAGDQGNTYYDQIALKATTYENLTELDTTGAATSALPEMSMDDEDDFFETMDVAHKFGSGLAILRHASGEPTTGPINNEGASVNVAVSGTSTGLLLTVLGVVLIFLLVTASKQE